MRTTVTPDDELLASCLLDKRTRQWNRDKRMQVQAGKLGIANQPHHQGPDPNLIQIKDSFSAA